MQDWIIIAVAGLVVGAGTFVVIPGKVRGGILLTMLVGAVAALIMTWMGRQIGWAVLGRPSILATIIAVAGTALVLAVWRWTMSRDMNKSL